MLGKLVRFVVGSRNDRLVKKKKKLVKKINALASEYEKLSDEALKAKTEEFRDRLAKGEKLESASRSFCRSQRGIHASFWYAPF